MSSTSNSQNLLVNVFRPTYVYDSTNGYRPRLVLSNLDGVVGTSGTFSNLNVGDSKSNVYVGISAGNPNALVDLCNSTGITALGLSAGNNNSNSSNSSYIGNATGCNTTNVTNSVYLGNSTGTFNSNCANSVYIGFNAANNLCNASNEIAIGTNAIGGGVSNIYIGPSTGSVGSNNIFIGPNIAPGNVSNELRIGAGDDVAIYSDLATKKIGINTTNPTTGFDVSGPAFFNNKVGIQYENPIHSLDVAGQIYATDGILIGGGNVNAPSIALVDETNTGVFVDLEGSKRSFGFTVRGKKMMTMSDTCLNVFGNLYVEGSFGQAAQSTSNAILTGYIRSPDIDGGTLDISSTGIKTIGNISAAGGTVNIGPGYITDTCTNGYIRLLNDSGVILTDISGGNISNSATTRSSNFIGTSSASNSIGGVILSNGGVDVSRGSATIPSYSFISDLSTGIHLNNVSSMGFDTAGIQRMCISGTNVGIGITTPVAPLHIQAPSDGNTLRLTAPNRPLIQFNNQSNDTSFGIIEYGQLLSDSFLRMRATQGVDLVFATPGTTERMRIATNGNVGIGTSNPVVRLEVVGDVSANTYNGPGGTAGAPHYTFSDDRTTGVFFPGANIVGLTAGGTERMRISNSNIGIGTTTPSNALDISGVLRIMGANGNITFSNGSIDVSGTPLVSSTGAFSNATITSNSIGGVTLSNTNISYAGTITGSTTNTSNQIGGITLSNNDISLTGSIVGLNTSSNRIGGITLSNNDISLTGSIIGLNTSSNRIGGITLSNQILDAPNSLRIGDGLMLVNPCNVPTSGSQAVFITGPYNSPVAGRVLFGDGSGWRLHFGSRSGGNNTDRFTFTDQGSFGIGTTAPGNPIDISSGSQAALINLRTTYSGTGGANGVGYLAPNIPSGTLNGFFLGKDGNASNSGALRYTHLGDGASSNYVSLTNFGTAGININQVGNVGIGTTNPAASLDVSSSGVVSAVFRNNTAQASIRVVGNGFSDTSSLQLYHNNNEQGLFNWNTLPFHIWTNNTRRLTIGGTGDTQVSGNFTLGDGGSGTYRRISLGGGNSFGYLYGNFDVLGDGVHLGYNYVVSNGSNFIHNTGLGTCRITVGAGSVAILTGDVSSIPTTLGFFQNSTGKVGIGTSSPSFQLQLSTDSAAKPTTNTWTVSSDMRIKQNIQDADTSLCYDIVKNLKLKRFTWDVSYMPNVPDRNSVGWIAQDVSEVFPNAITRVKNQWFDDFHSLDVDQIYKTMYGAIHKLIEEQEVMKLEIQSLKSQLLNNLPN